jgi:hypothetical protein
VAMNNWQERRRPQHADGCSPQPATLAMMAPEAMPPTKHSPAACLSHPAQPDPTHLVQRQLEVEDDERGEGHIPGHDWVPSLREVEEAGDVVLLGLEVEHIGCYQRVQRAGTRYFELQAEMKHQGSWASQQLSAGVEGWSMCADCYYCKSQRRASCSLQINKSHCHLYFPPAMLYLAAHVVQAANLELMDPCVFIAPGDVHDVLAVVSPLQGTQHDTAKVCFAQAVTPNHCPAQSGTCGSESLAFPS